MGSKPAGPAPHVQAFAGDWDEGGRSAAAGAAPSWRRTLAGSSTTSPDCADETSSRWPNHGTDKYSGVLDERGVAVGPVQLDRVDPRRTLAHVIDLHFRC